MSELNHSQSKYLVIKITTLWFFWVSWSHRNSTSSALCHWFSTSISPGADCLMSCWDSLNQTLNTPKFVITNLMKTTGHRKSGFRCDIKLYAQSALNLNDCLSILCLHLLEFRRTKSRTIITKRKMVWGRLSGCRRAILLKTWSICHGGWCWRTAGLGC